eukprot:scaffold3048_cov103-Cylindrotheca_fusiformis.AAC.1
MPADVKSKCYYIKPFQLTALLSTACLCLTRITLPFSVREIGNSAFRDCKSLERLSLHEGLERIGSAAFKGCTRLGGVDIPPTVQVIHNGAFQLCTSLERLGLEEGVRFIGEAAFKGWECLSAIDIPSTVLVIYDGAFRNCKRPFHKCGSLKRLGLNEGRKRIGLDSFYGYESLRTVEIPSTVVNVEESAFQDFEKLQRLLMRDGKCAFSRCG